MSSTGGTSRESRQRMTKVDLTFGYSGAFAAIRRSLWTPLPQGTLLDDVYEPLAAFFRGYRILMEPTATMYDFHTVLHFSSSARCGCRRASTMLSIMPRNGQLAQSHAPAFPSAKYGRIVIPYCMIAVALATVGLPPYWRAVAAWGQILFYALALLDVVVPDGTALKKTHLPVRTFVVLMAASLAAVRVSSVQPTSLWKEATYRSAIAEAPANGLKVQTGSNV